MGFEERPNFWTKFTLCIGSVQYYSIDLPLDCALSAFIALSKTAL